MTELNNIAQSNYDRFISATSVPSREMTEVEVGNPYHERARVWIMAGHSNPLYRTYLEHAWLYLDPGETRRVRVMYEYAPDHMTNDVYPPEERKKFRKLQREPNRVAFASYIENPRDHPRHSIDVLSGVDVEVVTGKSTRFERFVVDGQSARGTVVTAEEGKGVSGGKVIVRVSPRKAPDEKSSYVTVPVREGNFSAKLRGEGRWAKAFYVPARGYADCESDLEAIE